MRTRLSTFGTFLSLLGAATLVAACSGGGGGGGLPSFRVNGVSVTNNGVLKINRAIQISFTEDIDFSTVSLNTVRIASAGGVPVTGTFTQVDSRTISFQPTCPTQPDFSDGGFLPGGVEYELAIIAASAGNPLAVRSRGGAPIQISETRRFFTPNSSDPTELFFDTLPGAPAPVVRDVGGTQQNSSYVEIAGDPNNRVFFERDPMTGAISVNPPTSLALNLYSAEDTSIAFVIAINQPISPLASNISQATARLQYMDAGGTWRDLETRVSLTANCSGTGARLRLEPVGVLPSNTMVRAVLTTLLEDLVGETNLVPLDAFAIAATAPAPTPFADDFVENFNTTANLDQLVAFAEPRAEWGQGELRAAFSFPGTGGSTGDFDWRVPTQDVEIINTTFDTIRGGPGFTPQFDLPVVGGVIDVNNLEIPAGAEIRAIGPNPLTIYASGTVRIEGTINVSGEGNLGANTVGTANTAESGSPGRAGGGNGGDASGLTTISTPVGDTGAGPFQRLNGGGTGGESGWGSTGGNEGRRGAGAGGGRFGPNQLNQGNSGTDVFDQTALGLDAENGFPSSGGSPPTENGAFDGTQMGHYDADGAQGGLVGGSPFSDQSSTNDFFGRQYDPLTMTVTQGELLQLSAGAGGGGGGDAVSCPGSSCVFPPPWNPATNQKGGAGGGGSGSVVIVALGDVIFAGQGQIRARGGFGGHGESVGNFMWIGGGGGGGSGGHVIIQTAGRIDFTGMAQNRTAIIATGGQGAAGRNNQGGANQFGEDNIPTMDACWETGANSQCFGFVQGAGGDGGPGVIQLHAEGGLLDILLPGGTTLDDLASPNAQAPLIPVVGKRSRAQSDWIPLGLGGFRSMMAGFTPPTFSFGGTDPMTGLVMTNNQMVTPISPPVLGPAMLAAAPTLPYIDPADDRTLVMDSSSLSPEQMQNPSLLKRFVVNLFQTGNPSNDMDFEIVAATVDTMAGEARLTVSASGPALDSFQPLGTVSAQVYQTFFVVETDGVVNSLPDTASITIQFEATTASVLGQPIDPVTPMFTPDITTLNDGTDYRFLRFQVLFDIDTMTQGLGLDSPQPGLRFLRLPFAY